MDSKLVLFLQRAALLPAVLFSSLTPALLAQSAGTAGLTGTVTDPSGAVVPGVTVTLTSTDTNQARTTTTSQEGVYKFSLIPPGNYKVKFEASGFKLAEIASVPLNVTETPVLDRKLEVGAANEQVVVEAAAETLQTSSSTLGTTVTSGTVTALPLSSRNYTQILGLAAGASTGANNATAFGKGTQDISTNGADPGQNNFQMDGVAINNIANPGTSADSGIYAGIGIPSPDAIQEFKIQTSTYDASYGRNPGANVNVVTKSGTNAFHGTAFEFFRNSQTECQRLLLQSRHLHCSSAGSLPEAGSEPEPVRRRHRRTHQERQDVLLRQLSGHTPEERNRVSGFDARSHPASDSGRRPQRTGFRARAGGGQLPFPDDFDRSWKAARP